MFLQVCKNCHQKWKKLGPGLITGASDDDPSGIATYSQVGAKFNLSLLWTALITYPLMFGIQEMCARIGIVTSKGLAGIIRKNYPKPFLYILILLIFPAIIFNIASDLAGMSAVCQLFLPEIPSLIFALLFTIILICGLVFFSYNQLAKVLKWLTLSLLVYFVVPFLVQKNWVEVLKATFIPELQWNKEFMTLLVAVFGTTLSPYLFFWQASMSLEDKNHHQIVEKPKLIKDMRLDVNVGMLASNLVMFFIILTTASVLFPAGLRDIQTVEQAAAALKPLAGEFAYILFALGVIGTGLLAVPVLAGCLGYILANAFGWEKGMDKKFNEARQFYITILLAMVGGLAINIFNIDPIKSLIYTAVIYGIITPFLIAILLHVCNRKDIMGAYVNGIWINILGFLALIIMGLAAIALPFL